MAFTFSFRMIPLASRNTCLTIVSVLLLGSGCVPVTDRIIPGHLVSQERATHESGDPEVSVQPHPDNQGWTVTVAQPMVREIQVTRRIQIERHWYYWNPLTLPVGLFACPSTAWAWALSLLMPYESAQTRRQLVDDTVEVCLLALMIARSKPERTAETITTERREEPDALPVREGQVTLEWNGPEPVAVAYPLGPDGRAIVRMSHLGASLQKAGYALDSLPETNVTLSIWQKGKRLLKTRLDLTPTAIRTALRHHLPVIAVPARWPRPLVARIRLQETPPRTLRIEEHLNRLALSHGILVFTSEEAQPLLRHELQQGLSAMTDDRYAPSPGHWLAPTVLLTVRTEESARHSMIALHCHHIHTGELLAHIEVSAGPEGLGLAVDVALAKLDEALKRVVPLQPDALLSLSK